MRFVRFFVDVGKRILGALCGGWIKDAVGLFKAGLEKLRALCARRRLPHPDRQPDQPCMQVDHPTVLRADPCIYSQSFLVGQGLPVTWDNPDIVLRRGGIIVPEDAVEPDTEYEIEATIWNNSYDAPVAGMRVDFSFLSFGVGTTSNPVGSTFVDVGVKGSLLHPGQTRIPWRTPAIPGHYCLQVQLNWPNDANPANNLGQNNLNVVKAASPAQFSFQLRNAGTRSARYSFTVDTYRLLPRDPCPETRPPVEKPAERVRRIVAEHRSRDLGIPPGWTVVVSPAEVLLAPGQEVSVSVEATPPPSFIGDQPFNVAAFADGALAGGVTLIARVG